MLNLVPFSPLDLFFAKRLLARTSCQEESCLIFLSLLLASSRQGHVCLPLEKDKLSLQVLPLFAEAPHQIDPLCRMALQGVECLPEELLAHVQDRGDLPTKPICRYGNAVYLQKHWIAESSCLTHLKRLAACSPQIQLIPTFSESNLNKEQQEAIEKAMTHCLSIITGGPGTGKTYTAAHLVARCLAALPLEKAHQFEVILAAPTGKAVTHLEKNILKYLPSIPQLKSGTLHALLEVKRDQEKENHSILLADLVIVDECSMIDANLFALLSQAVVEGTRLVLIGDPDQIPPVEAGSFFADLIDTDLFPTTHLKRSLRVERQEISDLADHIRNGDTSAIFRLDSPAVKRIDLHMRYGYESTFASLFWSHIQHRFPEPSDKEPDLKQLLAANDAFRILCCMRQGPFGVDAINDLLFQRFFHTCLHGQWLAIPILITRNDYSMQLYNGDTGFLIKRFSLDRKFRKVCLEDYAVFPSPQGEMRRISALALPPFEYAYCLSVHKSQGSEYDEILLLIPEGSEAFGREVLYTAVTRARRVVTWDGPEGVVEKAIQTRSRKVSGMGLG